MRDSSSTVAGASLSWRLPSAVLLPAAAAALSLCCLLCCCACAFFFCLLPFLLAGDSSIDTSKQHSLKYLDLFGGFAFSNQHISIRFQHFLLFRVKINLFEVPIRLMMVVVLQLVVSYNWILWKLVAFLRAKKTPVILM